MNATEIKTLATKMFNATKKNLADARKYNKDNKTNAWTRKAQQVNISVYDHDIWKGGNRTTEYYVIKVGSKEIGNCTYRSDIESVFREFGNMLDAQKKVKGWSGLNYTSNIPLCRTTSTSTEWAASTATRSTSTTTNYFPLLWVERGDDFGMNMASGFSLTTNRRSVPVCLKNSARQGGRKTRCFAKGARRTTLTPRSKEHLPTMRLSVRAKNASICLSQSKPLMERSSTKPKSISLVRSLQYR